MPEITESQVRREIESGALSGLYFLYGEEKYLVALWARRLVKKAAGKGFPEFNLQQFGGDARADAIADAVEALPFMAERKCVVVRDLTMEGRTPAEQKKMQELVSGVPESTVLVLQFASSSPALKKEKKWKDFYTLCVQHGKCVAFSRRKPADLHKLLIAAAGKRGCVLDRSGAQRMVAYCGDSLETLLNELEKLCAFTGSGPIQSGTIDQLVTRNLEARVFDLSKHLLAGRYAEAYEMLDLLLSQGEEPVGILAVLCTTYLDLYRVRCAVQSGEGALEPASHFDDYKRKEFRLRNAENNMRKLSTQQLRDSLEVLLEADLSLKGSRTAPRILLEKALAKLLVIASGEEDA